MIHDDISGDTNDVSVLSENGPADRINFFGHERHDRKRARGRN